MPIRNEASRSRHTSLRLHICLDIENHMVQYAREIGSSGQKREGSVSGSTGRILLVGDPTLAGGAVARGLSSAGHLVLTGTGDSDVGRSIDAFEPDIIVASLDGGRADKLASLHDNVQIPVIVLASDDASPEQRADAHRAGADSVFVEPIHPDELVARVDTLVARRQTRDLLIVFDLTIDRSGHVVRHNGVTIHLTTTEFKLLLDLATHAGKVLSKRQLLERVWAFDEYDDNVVEAHISALRRKLEVAGPRLVQTVRGFGYVLRLDDSAQHPEPRPSAVPASEGTQPQRISEARRAS